MLLSSLLLSGCAIFENQSAYGNQYAAHLNDPLEITSDRAKIFFVFSTPEETANVCKRITGNISLACTAQNAVGEWIIYAVKPLNWNNKEALAILGHEVAHTLGAQHFRLSN